MIIASLCSAIIHRGFLVMKSLVHPGERYTYMCTCIGPYILSVTVVSFPRYDHIHMYTFSVLACIMEREGGKRRGKQ